MAEPPGVIVAFGDDDPPHNLAGQAGHIKMFQDPVSLQYWLFDNRTDELVSILRPPQGEWWDLEFTDSDHPPWAFIGSDSESHWAGL